MALEPSDQPAQREKAASVTAPGTVAPPPIPDHELLRRIGGGSYGEVWLARNIMGTFRAVKIVYRRHFQDGRPYEREFSGIQKFEPLSRSHEGLVDVLQMGRSEEAGYFYYVMELADCALLGGAACRLQQAESPAAPDAAGPAPDRVTCLESCVRRGSEQYRPATVRTEIADHGRLPFEQCLSIGLAMASALEHLHRHGLVHRDVKPSNIILVNGIPKLADIGLVTGTDATVSFVGTEGFIPPEGPGTVQADIFGLGKVLYELTTGKDRHDFPEPPTLLGEFADRAELLELDEVIQKACAADPRRRYGSAAQMHEDLLLVKTGKSVRDKHALERRLKLMTRAGAVAAVVLALGAVAYMLAVREVGVAEGAAKTEAGLREQAEQATLDTKAARREERKHRMQAEAEAKKAETEAAKSEQVAQFLKDMLNGVGPSVALGRDTTMLREILDKTAQRVGMDLTNQPEVEAELRRTIGGGYEQLGQYGRAEDMLRRELAMRRKVLGEEHLEVAASLNRLAGVLLWGKKSAEAEILARQGLTMRRRLLGNEHRHVAASLNTVASALVQQDKLPEAEAMHSEAVAMARKVLGREDPDLRRYLTDLAYVLWYERRLAEAETLSREAVAMARELTGNEHPDVLLPLRVLANVLDDQGKYPEAETLFREVVGIARKVYGNDNERLGVHLNNLAGLLRRRGKLAESETLDREWLEWLQRLRSRLPADDPAIATALIARMNRLFEEAQFAEAEPLAMECLAIREKKLPGSWPTYNARSMLGGSLLGQKKYAEAEPLLLSAYKGLKQQQDIIPPYSRGCLAETLRRLAQLYEATGQSEKAAEWKQKLAESEKVETEKQAKALIQRGAETNGAIKSATSIASPSPSPGRP